MNFSIVGAAGYIAPKHLDAIKAIDGTLVVAYDPSTTVGVLDSYFHDARYFQTYEEYIQFVLDCGKNPNKRIRYTSICSPNHLHYYHCMQSLHFGSNVICEKPLVGTEQQLDSLLRKSNDSGLNVFGILQLRLHPKVIALREMVLSSASKMHKVSLRYITSRGDWYLKTWKGQPSLSFGLVANIGIHFFDMLIWIFGSVRSSSVESISDLGAKGFLVLGCAEVNWELSIDINDVPEAERALGKRTFRSITVDDRELEFSDGFTDLHRVSYQKIVTGAGFSLEDARPAIRLVEEINNVRR